MGSSEGFDIQQGDAVDYLRRLPVASVDLIVTDPAYESLEKHRAKGTTTRLSMSKGSSNPWFPIFPNHRFVDFFHACYCVLKNNSHFYMFCDDETAYIAKPIAEAVGFKYWKRIVWDKMRIGMGYHFRAQVEYILFFEKGKRRINDLGMPDIFDFHEDAEAYVLQCQKVANGYPTEKPVLVSEKLIYQSAKPGDIVCDPFMGSASVGVAAIKQGCTFWGNDISEASLEVAQPRLDKAMEFYRPKAQAELSKEP